MDNQKLRAIEWAKDVVSEPEKHSLDAHIAAEHILATNAELTMADIRWDETRHHLAGATTNVGNSVVMMWLDHNSGRINTAMGSYRPDALTPNDRRYELVKVKKSKDLDRPVHPEALCTEEDFDNAPEGTIVADSYADPWVKHDHMWYSHGSERDSEDMVTHDGLPVVRWGGITRR